MDGFLFIIKSFILGIVEGLSEFLPISSTGHLIVFQNLLGFTSSTENYIDMYTYVIQLGAILAVVVLFRNKILRTLKTLVPQKDNFKKSGFYFWLMIALACVPGFFAEILIGRFLEPNYISVCIFLIIGAVLLYFAEAFFATKRGGGKPFSIITPKQALIIGAFQCLSIFPGMSRSASTIMGGWVAGLSTVASAEFSFFLAIPVMLGMSVLKIGETGGLFSLSAIEILSLVVGFLVSFIVALICVKGFIDYLKKKPMKVFAYYRIIFAIVVLILGLFGMFKV
ncbi:MAG: undecaprenyl-diphosphate phosphatase [Ruminococcaceae bacterium]|nr:undecaprenyl-diphosphate phosphatase [Oscillospiraceae bacterium]